VAEMTISAKDKLGYINRDFPQPSQEDPTFYKWHIENFVVKGWLVNSMDLSFVANFICFPCGMPLQLHILMELTRHKFMNFDVG
jgi:hypothetical protein